MSKHGMNLSLCAGLLAGLALLSGSAGAMTKPECGALGGNQLLAAIERGTCKIDIQTAAGPDTTLVQNDSGDGTPGDPGDRNGRGERGGNRDGGGNDGGDGGGDGGGGGRTGGSRTNP